MRCSGLFDWHADFVDRVFFRFPLNNVHAVDFVAIKAVPDVLPGQCGHGPVVPLADHLFSDVIFPFRPVHLGIGRDVFVEDDDREIQAVMHFESAVTLGPPITALHCASERGPAALAARHLVLVTIRQR